MPYQPAILGTARLGNFRLGYQTAAMMAVRPTKSRITLADLPVRVRVGSVIILDVANDAPNTCSLTVDAATPPVSAQRLRITINSDDPRLLFDGALETVEETYEGLPSQLVYPCTAQDDTPRANRRIPFGYWENTPADQVAIELVTDFAPGFTTNGVQAGLPNITVHFEGSEAGMNGCLRQIAKLFGGYFYWAARDLHLFTSEATDLPDDLDSTPGRILDGPQHITITWDDSQLRTRVYGKGHQESTLSDVAAGGSSIPLGDVSMYNPAGGQVISESQIFDYTGTVIGGLGSLLGTTITPTNGPTVTARATAGMTAGARNWAVTFGTASGRTLPSPVTAHTVGGEVPTPTSAPTAGTPTAGGSVTAGNHDYAVAYVTAGGETRVSPIGNQVTALAAVSNPSAIPTPSGQADANALFSGTGTLKWSATFKRISDGVETALATEWSGAQTWTGLAVLIPLSGLSAPPSGYVRQWYRTEMDGSTFKRVPVNSSLYLASNSDYYQGREFGGYLVDLGGALGATAPASNGTALQTIPITGIPIGPAGITQRNLYRRFNGTGTFKLVTNISNNTATTHTDTAANGSLGADALTTATALALSVDLTSISVGPTGTTFRDVWRTVGAGSQLKLLTTLSNNSTTVFTDTTADGSLGADIHVTDTSGLVGQAGDVPAGATSALVTSTAPFHAAGGWAFIGALPIRYTGFSADSLTGIPVSGPGAFTTSVRYGVEVIAANMLTGVSGLVRALIKGAPIHIWVERNDLTAQADLAAREGEGDGIIEHRIVDERRGEASLIALCDADLAQFSRPLVTVRYATRDVKTKSGKPIVIDLPSPLIDETLTIQDVTIDQIDIAPGLAPRFTVTASSMRFSVEDLLRQMASGLGGL